MSSRMPSIGRSMLATIAALALLWALVTQGRAFMAHRRICCDEEWYATRLIFREQGQLVYEGDRVKVPEWRIPDHLYYRADGPTLEYKWYVFVERDNPDGSTTQLSPDSETRVFRWE